MFYSKDYLPNVWCESVIWPGITIIDLFHSLGHLVIRCFLDILQMTWCLLSTLSHKELSIDQDVCNTFTLFNHGNSQEQWSSAAIFIVSIIFHDNLQLVLFRTSEMTETLK